MPMIGDKLLKYLITDPSFCTNNPIKLYKILNKSYKNHNPNISCFRDKKSKNTIAQASKFVKISKKKNIKYIAINSDIKLAIRVKANTVHLTSNQFDKIRLARKKKLFVIISTHNEKEIRKAKRNRANMITYSPIFKSPNKGEPKGIDNLKKTIRTYKIPTIALGGIISKKEINLLKQTKVQGFASIRYFF